MIATKTPAVEEFLKSGDNERFEYAQGEKWEKPLANKDQASLQAGLGYALRQYGLEGGNGKPFPAWQGSRSGRATHRCLRSWETDAHFSGE
jgi:hypothetical protein